MIYVAHDFYSNFTSAVDGKDAAQQREILLGEIARIIIKDRDEVIVLIRKCGGKVGDNPSDAAIVTQAVKLFGNDTFQKGMAYLISMRNDISNGEKKSGAIDPISGIAQGIGSIATGVGSIFSAGAQKEVAAQNTQAIQDANRTALMLKILDLKGAPKPNNTGKYILIGVVSLAIVIGAVIILRKKK